MKEKREYWQAVRGICILAVVLIHSLGGFDYTVSNCTEFVILRQVINFAVAVFVFMAGYFVDIDRVVDKNFNYKNWLLYRGGRLCIPFVIWSLIYSELTLLKNIYNGVEINWLGFVYRFIVGKSATPFYYIVVLIQLTVITPWLVKIVKEKSYISKALWLVTPTYLLYVYAWNVITGTSPYLYETLFPAWFGFYTSQITVGSFLYSVTMIGWLLRKSEKGSISSRLLSKIGDCSYGIFYIHMAVLMVVGRFVKCEKWYAYWIIRFALTASISFGIVYIGQKVLMHHKKLLRYIGFV